MISGQCLNYQYAQINKQDYQYLAQYVQIQSIQKFFLRYTVSKSIVVAQGSCIKQKPGPGPWELTGERRK